jgi:hypothetical protein
VTVHVWKGDRYIGHVVAGGREHGIAVRALDTDEGREVEQLILRGPSDYVQVSVGGEKIELEFPSDDWLGISCLMLLPPAGYRVHVIRNANG